MKRKLHIKNGKIVVQRLIPIKITVFSKLNKGKGTVSSLDAHMKSLQTQTCRIFGILHQKHTLVNYLLYTAQVLIMLELYACNLYVMGNAFLAPG